ncbi:HNH endonuclease [Corallococcus exiguus]|nr:HNH endonuclease [Corallococcus exiguus]
MTRKANLPHGQRRLRLGGNYSFPITMSHVDDIDKLRKVLSAAQKPIGQSPGSKGGNGQKTIRLYIGINAVGVDLSVLGRELAEPPQSAVVSEADIAGAANVADVDKRFDPGSIEDARSRILASIVQRQGQPAFRRELLSAYGGKCAITQCELEEVLEAAHVYPFRGSVTNVVQNGLLLRSDIHTLFDRGLIAVDTADWSILIHEKLVSTCYSVLSGRKLSLPLNHQMHPNTDALDRHRADSGL